MLRRITWLSSLFVFLLAAGWLLHFCIVRPSDYARVKQLLEPSPIVKKNRVAHQQRKGIVKELWITSEDHGRLHDEIHSEDSVLSLIPYKNKVEVVEHLGKTKFWMQDKLYLDENKTPMQQIRFFTADHGIYRFQSHAFTANRATLSFFRLPGHKLSHELSTQQAYLKGNAKDLSCSLSGKEMRFEADTFRARLTQ